VSVSAHLLRAEIRDLQKAIICQSDDQAFSLLKICSTNVDWSKLGPCCPNQSDVFVDQEKVVEGAKNRHKAGSFKHNFVLYLMFNVFFSSLFVLENIGPERSQMIR